MIRSLVRVLKRSKITLLVYTILHQYFRYKIIRGKNNIIKKDGIVFKCRFDISGSNNIIQIKKNAQISNLTIVIRGSNNFITIEESVMFRRGSIAIEDNNNKIIIGSSTTIESADFMCIEGQQISIGKGCMLSHGISFRTSDSHSILDKNTGCRVNLPESIQINNSVWIGADCVILKGAYIASESIIGLRSVVTTKLDIPNSIYVGAPAKICKRDITWCRERLN